MKPSRSGNDSKPSKPSPPSVGNKIPVCCDYYDEPCSDSDEDEEYESLWEEGQRGDAEGNAAPERPRKRCRKVPKKRARPCVRRSQVKIPGVPPEQFGGSRPCRTLHPKPCRKRLKKSKDSKKEASDEGGLRDGEAQDGEARKGKGRDGGGSEDEACEEEDEGKESGDRLNGGQRYWNLGEGAEYWNQSGGGLGNGGNAENQRLCKKRRKKKRSPCRVPDLAFPEDNTIFPSLPRPNLGEKPPEQKFPPAEDDSRSRKRGGTCRKKRRPCRKRGSSSSSCTTSSSDD